MSNYLDYFTCPRCGRRRIIARRSSSIGKKVKTYCDSCRHTFKVEAGKPKEIKP